MMWTGIAFFLLSVIALLAIPVTVTFDVSRRRALHGRFLLTWAFGLVRIPIPLSKAKPPSPETDEAVRKSRRAQRRSTNSVNPIALIRQRDFRRRILKFITDLWHAIDKRNIRLRIRLGLGDPADTGRLWAIVGPLAGLLANVKEARLEIEPEFMDALFELDSRGTIRLIPLQIITLVIALLLSPSVWQGIRQMRDAA